MAVLLVVSLMRCGRSLRTCPSLAVEITKIEILKLFIYLALSNFSEDDSQSMLPNLTEYGIRISRYRIFMNNQVRKFSSHLKLCNACGDSIQRAVLSRV